MPNLLDPTLEKTLTKDKQYLTQTQLPIVTVSASFQEDIKGFHGLPEDESKHDVVFSRAHYSMAFGIAQAAWNGKIEYKKAWLIDPTNYVSRKNWRSIIFTETVGKILARHSFLKYLKDLVDQFGRQKLPILPSITPPLLTLTEQIQKPILSLHVAVGNILAGQGKRIIQVITDPHVRDEYLKHADLPSVTLCVFDQKTKTEVLEKAALLNKQVDPERVIVTGPPIDPRIVASRHKKQPWRSGALRLCLTTGGLGTNKEEIRHILDQLLPELRKRDNQIELLVFAATHPDIAEMVIKMAREQRVGLTKITSETTKTALNAARRKTPLSLMYHPQIVDANELLIKHAFPWAHGFITKPSGDMAYDAAASGSFLLTLQEWGEWEYNVREVFEQRGIARKAITHKIVAQLEALTDTSGKAQSWVEKAMHQAQQLDPLFLHGARNIIEVHRSVAAKKR